MDQFGLNKNVLQQMYLAMKDMYSLVISINYTQNTYSIINSKLSSVPVCENRTDFLKLASQYFSSCYPEDLINYPLICDLDSLIDHLENNNGYYSFETRIEILPSVFKWYEGTYLLVDAPDSDDTILLLLFKDITDKKLIEENLRDAFKVTEISAKAKTDFLSRMSQDLRTPISLIVSMIDLARKNIDDKEKVTDCLVKMDISSRYLFQLIDNILDMSRLEAGKFSIDNVPFNILDVLDEIKSSYSARATSKNITFEVRENTNGLTNLVGDSVRLTQVLKNLVSNSFQYTPEGGFITMELFLNKVTYNRAFFSFIVENNGPPMDETQIERLFRPFERGGIAGHSKCFEGLGLGLSICKNTIELLGGSITASNAPEDSGVIFEVDVSFGLDESNVPNNIETLADSAYIRFPKKTILVADDDEHNYETIKSLLESRGITVDLAINGLEAVHAFEKAPSGYYDLILMNIDLPLMSGIDATTAIRNSFHENGDTIPIVAMSVDVLDQNVILALDSGMTSHIVKPINMNLLFSTLNNYL